jgi:hypothetical protein
MNSLASIYFTDVSQTVADTKNNLRKLLRDHIGLFLFFQKNINIFIQLNT